MISYIGSFFNFLTLVYIGEPLLCLFLCNFPKSFLVSYWINLVICLDIASGILLSLSVPLLYEKYQDQIDDKLIVAHKVIQIQYRKLDESVLRKIPFPKNKEKKTQ